MESHKHVRSKHYTPTEKSLFLQILNSYKHIIECKKSDASTLKEKESAWKIVTEKFNNTALITQERSLQQLKKLWTNIKQTQRDILTKERQQILGTGGGPCSASIEIDPDVATIAPTLMATAPVLFSSNMSNDEIQDQIVRVEDVLEGGEDLTFLAEETAEPENDTQQYVERTPREKIPKKRKQTKAIEMEEDLKILRIKKIMQQEEELAEEKLKNERAMAALREAHENRMAASREEHLKKIQELEIAYYNAKAELAIMLLEKEKNQ